MDVSDFAQSGDNVIAIMRHEEFSATEPISNQIIAVCGEFIEAVTLLGREKQCVRHEATGVGQLFGGGRIYLVEDGQAGAFFGPEFL